MTASLTLRPSLYEELVPGGGHTSFVLKRAVRDLESDRDVARARLGVGHDAGRRAQRERTAIGRELHVAGAQLRVEHDVAIAHAHQYLGA